ncbi:MAG: DUF1289 domain-containing protein [Alphaproteobacteria bacterium]|nr:DUF1289 domain-containing protein [Alphaproteobacteria bacterium]
MPYSNLPPLPSPCKGICCFDADKQFCIGCLRTLEQIRDWPDLDNTGRLAILGELKTKRDQMGERVDA